MSSTATRTLDLPLDAREGGSLRVRMDRGNLRVRTGEPGAAHLEIRLKGRADTEEKARELADRFSPNVSAEDGEIRIEVECGQIDEVWSWFGRRSGERVDAEVTITVPRRQHLRLELESGNLEAEGTEGTLEAFVKAGNLRLGEVAGDAHARVTSGLIKIRRVTGRLTAQAQAGGVEVGEAGESVEISTESGDIVTRLVHPLREDSRVSTKVGQIRVELAEQVGAEVDARVRTGRVVSDYPLDSGEAPTPNERRGTINGGGHRLTLSTHAGHIRLARAV